MITYLNQDERVVSEGCHYKTQVRVFFLLFFWKWVTVVEWDLPPLDAMSLDYDLKFIRQMKKINEILADEEDK
jgi:hypothetical protein